MATAAQGTNPDAAKMEQLKQQEAAYLKKLEEQAKTEKSGLGRLAQGMRNVGSNFAPAVKRVGQDIEAKIGNVLVAQPVKGVKGLLFNIFPENLVGAYVLFIMFVYWYSWMAGFAAPLVLPTHAIMAVIGFFLFVYVEYGLEGKGAFLQVVRRNGVTFSVLMIIDGMLLTGQIQWNLILIAALLLAFREGNPLEDLKRVAMVMLVASAVAAVAPFLYNQFNQLFFSALAKIALPLNFEVLSLNFSYLPFILGLLANRTFTYPFFWFAIFRLSEKTRVARSLAWIVMLLFIFASWPNIAPEVGKLHSQYITGTTPEQREFWPTIFKQATTNARGAVISLFQSFSVRTASAYEKKYGELEQTFGFGQPKEQPKLGLALVEDSTMLKKYNLDFKEPEPSFIMRVTSPFPADAKQQYLEVINARCYDKSNNKLTPKKDSPPVFTSKGVTPTPNEPLKVFYNGPDGGTQVRCAFDNWESGDYAITAEVDYKVDATAFLTTAFINSKEDEALRLRGLDPAAVDKIPPARAQYDNMPLALTWAPDLKKSPVSIDIGEPKNANNPITGGAVTRLEWDVLNTVYVSKNAGWQNGEIKSVTSLSLTVPKGVKLVGKSCDFDLNKAKTNDDGRIEYPILGSKIKDKGGNFQFIGDAIKFDCGMKVSKEALSGADWAPARFDVVGSFIFTTKLDSIRFTVEGGKNAGTAPAFPLPTQQPATASPTLQQLQDTCIRSKGTWDATGNLCDCGAGTWKDYRTGCEYPPPPEVP